MPNGTGMLMTFCLWLIDKDANLFLTNLSCLVNFKFTHETETDNTLEFLDYDIHRDENDLRFSIYLQYYSAHHN